MTRNEERFFLACDAGNKDEMVKLMKGSFLPRAS
jgi:hypothetical protein